MTEWPLWEIFIRSQHGLAHKHVGSLHAPDAEMAVKSARDGGDYAAWTLERNGMRWPLSFVHNVVEYFQGQWTTAATQRGNELTMVLSAQ